MEPRTVNETPTIRGFCFVSGFILAEHIAREFSSVFFKAHLLGHVTGSDYGNELTRFNARLLTLFFAGGFRHV